MLYRRIAELSSLVTLLSLLSPISDELVTHMTPGAYIFHAMKGSIPLSKGGQVSLGCEDATRYVTPRKGLHGGPQK